MCRRCFKLLYGTEPPSPRAMSSADVRAWWEKQLGRLGLKESLMDLFKEELRATRMHVGPTFDFSKLRLTPRSAEWLEEYRRRHPSPVEIGKLICETEPIMTNDRSDFEIVDEHAVCVAIKREPVESPTVKNYRNAEGEVVRTEYYDEKGELVMTEEVLGMECRDPVDIELLHPNPDQQAYYDEQVAHMKRALDAFMLPQMPKDRKP